MNRDLDRPLPGEIGLFVREDRNRAQLRFSGLWRNKRYDAWRGQRCPAIDRDSNRGGSGCELAHARCASGETHATGLQA